MNILINASNLSGGGGAQVADSLCRYLKDYPKHSFIAVLSKALDGTAQCIENYPNVKVVMYNYPPKDWHSFFTQRNKFLDGLVEDFSIECVLTVFGPMKWRPKCPHVCGFALSQVVIPESPFYKRMSFAQRVKSRIQAKLWAFIFWRSAKYFYTENELITKRLQKLFWNREVHTITNNYNQVFKHPENWKRKELPSYDGVQLLSVTSSGCHKNLPIALDVAKILKDAHPDFKFRFVFTIDSIEFPAIPDELKDCFLFTGKVSISECPSLYDQCDFEFQSTLLECFTATYPEAMVMQMPIITTDLEFARGICGEAALYYNPTSAQSAADAIYKLSTDKELQRVLIGKGVEQLTKFDSNEQRVNKILTLCEQTAFKR
jgi:glycosyltransferase involved in cell wall biosynthesis